MAQVDEESLYVCPADLNERELRGLKIDGQWILIAKFKGEYFALDAACAHSGYPLFEGAIDEQGVITCPLHYAKFDCKTGAVCSKPRICDDQITFKIEVKEGKVYWVRPKSP